MKKIISIIALLIVATTGITKAQDDALVAEIKNASNCRICAKI